MIYHIVGEFDREGKFGKITLTKFDEEKFGEWIDLAKSNYCRVCIAFY